MTRVLGTLEPGGAQLSALRLSAALRAHGIETTLIAGDATPAGLELAGRFGLRAEACRVSEAIPLGSLQWVPAPDFASWLQPRLARADLVHAHMMGAWWAAAQALPPRVPLVASEHNQMSWPAGDNTPQARQAARRVGLFFAHGPAARAWAAGIGVDDGRLRDGRSAVQGLSAAPLPGLASPRLTFAGRFRLDKAPDVLIEALALMRARPAAYLVGDGPLRGPLARLAAARGLDAAVHWPGWSYGPEHYIAGASVHVVPSREEAWSQSAVLGLGLGVPVVGTAVDGLALTLGEGRGVLVPPEDPAALAAALSRVLAGGAPDPAAGRAYARQFTPGAVAAEYARAYRQLLGGREAELPTGSPRPARMSMLSARIQAGNRSSSQAEMPGPKSSTAAVTRPVPHSHLEMNLVRRAMVTVVRVKTAAIRME
jgi:glycosyltransferase involved in cell wall biosynthesis